MEEIAVNEYVRTNGRIYKVLDMDNVFLYVDKEVRYSEEYNASIHYINRDEYEIEKHSPNIIDLIEVGDYVNGHKVGRIYEVPNKEIGKVIDTDISELLGWETEPLTIYKEDIKTIVTREQFKGVMYEVK